MATVKQEELGFKEQVLELNKRRNDLESDLIKSHSNIFANELPPFKEDPNAVQHHIKLHPNQQPPCAKLRRFSPREIEEINAQIKELITRNFIQPSKSPFGANVLLVKKSDGTWRLCIDYRALNQITVKDKFPLPNLQGQLQYLQQRQIFFFLGSHSGVLSSRHPFSGLMQNRISDGQWHI